MACLFFFFFFFASNVVLLLNIFFFISFLVILRFFSSVLSISWERTSIKTMYIPFAQFYIIRIRLRFMCAYEKYRSLFVLLVDRFMLQKLPWSTVSCSANNCFNARVNGDDQTVFYWVDILSKKKPTIYSTNEKKTCSLSGKRKQSINELHKWGDFFFVFVSLSIIFFSFLFESMSYKKCVCSITYFYS